MTEKPVHFATIVLALGVPPVEHDVCLKISALAELEAELKRNAFDLVAEAGKPMPFGVAEAIIILHVGMRAAGNPVSREGVRKFLEPMRPSEILVAAMRAINAAFFGPAETKPGEVAS